MQLHINQNLRHKSQGQLYCQQQAYPRLILRHKTLSAHEPQNYKPHYSPGVHYPKRYPGRVDGLQLKLRFYSIEELSCREKHLPQHWWMHQSNFSVYFPGMPLGYAFIEFLDHNIAHKVLHRLSGKTIPKSEPPVR